MDYVTHCDLPAYTLADKLMYESQYCYNAHKPVILCKDDEKFYIKYKISGSH